MIDGTEVIGRLVPALALVALAPLLLRRWMRKSQAKGGEDLRVVTRTAMGRSSSAVVVQTGRRLFLLGVTESSIGLIAELETLEDEEEVTDAGTDAPTLTHGPWTGLERWRQMTVRRLPETPVRVVDN